MLYALFSNPLFFQEVTMSDAPTEVKKAAISGLVTVVSAAVATAATNVLNWIGGLFNRKPKDPVTPTK